MTDCTNLATSNRSGLYYVVEVSCVGEEPVTPYDLQAVNQTSNDFDITQTNVQSETIRADRQRDELVNVETQAGGSFTAELRTEEYDLFLEAAFFDDFGASADITDDTFTFTFLSAGSTIADSALALLSLNLEPGQFIRLSTATGDNVGVYKVSETVAVTSGLLTLDPNYPLITEAAGDTYLIEAAEVLTNGIERKSFTMVKSHEDIDEFFVFNGMMVNTATINIEQGSIPTIEFAMVGTEGRRELSFPNGAGAELSPSVNPIFNPTTNIIGLRIDGVQADLVQSFSITINNNIEPAFALGSRAAVSVVDGSVEVTGSFELYFRDGAEFNKFAASQTSSLDIILQDNSGNVWVLTVPNFKYQSFPVPVPGVNELVVSNSTFTASIDPVLQYTVSLQKLMA